MAELVTFFGHGFTKLRFIHSFEMVGKGGEVSFIFNINSFFDFFTEGVIKKSISINNPAGITK